MNEILPEPDEYSLQLQQEQEQFLAHEERLLMEKLDREIKEAMEVSKSFDKRINELFNELFKEFK